MVIYYFEVDKSNIFFLFYRPITHLYAILHKNVIDFTIAFVIHMEMGM